MRTKSEIYQLVSVEEATNHLTLQSQERIRDAFIYQAQEMALGEVPEQEVFDKIYEFYYDALAEFMRDFPHVFIDLVLIKPCYRPQHEHFLFSMS